MSDLHAKTARTAICLVVLGAVLGLMPTARGGDMTADDLTVYGAHVVTQKAYLGSMSTNDMRLYYNYETNSSTVDDQSPNDFDGTVSGSSWTPSGQLDGAFDHDGSNDKIYRSDGAFLALDTNEFTVAAWVKVDAARNWGGIFSQGNIVASAVSGFCLCCRTDYKFAFRVREGGGACLDAMWGTYSTGEWYHLAGVRSYSSGNTVNTLYVNGEVVTNTQYAGTIDVDTTSVFEIGHGYTYFDGTIDESVIYTRALSSNEVHDLYLYNGTNFPTASLTVHSPATFSQGIQYMAKQGDLEMGSYTNQP